MNGKRGQFYLIAAIVIIIALFAVVGVTNQATTKTDTSNTYDLSKELNIEGGNVVDYGVYNNQGSSNELNQLLKNFTQQYYEYLNNQGEPYDFFFVYGDANTATLAQPKIIESGSITVQGADVNYLQTINQINYSTLNLDSSKSFNVTLDSNKYSFKLNQGQNFYFIIKKPKEKS